MISKIGFTGAGKVGTSLGRYFKENNIDVSGYYSKTKSHAADSAAYTNTDYFENLEELTKSCDTIFVCVPDDEISVVWKHMRELDIKGKNIVHCSGTLSSRVFEGASDAGAYAFSLHPMYSINDRKGSWKDLGKAYFSVEGDQARIEDIKSIPQRTGNPINEIDADSKILYHAAAVFVSNLVIGLTAVGQGILTDCGFPEDVSENAWKALFIGNAENIVNNGLTDALTGPVERADDDTVRKHLNSLSGRNRNIYMELSRMILDIAKLKHPGRDYTKIEKELTNEKDDNDTETM